MRGSQEDIGEMLVNLGASHTNSVYILKRHGYMRTCFRVSRWRRIAVWMFLNLGNVSGAKLFGEESSKGIEHERKFMMMMMLW